MYRKDHYFQVLTAHNHLSLNLNFLFYNNTYAQSLYKALLNLVYNFFEIISF